MKRNHKKLAGYQLLHQLVDKGFRSLAALVHICTTADATITNLDIQTIWFTGECDGTLELKLESVLENLKNE